MFVTRKRMGEINLTDSFEVASTMPTDIVKIISMDESKVVNSKIGNVIIGTILLPPPECLIAEVDGDEDLYDIHYVSYLNTPAVQDFVAAIVAALYQKINLLIYAPQLKENMSISKFMHFMWSLYGIGIGVLGNTKCQYDDRCIPIWVNMVYSCNVINVDQYIKDYPVDAPIPSGIMEKLIYDIKPYGKCYADKVKAVERFRHRYNITPSGDKRLRMPLYSID